MPGVGPQLETHLSMGMNTGLTEVQLRQAFDLIEKSISKEQAEIARRSLAKVNAATPKKTVAISRWEKGNLWQWTNQQSGWYSAWRRFFTVVSCSSQPPINREQTNTEKTKNKYDGAIFPKGERAPREYFTATVYLQMLALKTESNIIQSAVWCSNRCKKQLVHTSSRTNSDCIEGKGLYQEKSKPIKLINKGETIICNPDIEHWHGAFRESHMMHIAITNDKGPGGVVWL